MCATGTLLKRRHFAVISFCRTGIRGFHIGDRQTNQLSRHFLQAITQRTCSLTYTGQRPGHFILKRPFLSSEQPKNGLKIIKRSTEGALTSVNFVPEQGFGALFQSRPFLSGSTKKMNNTYFILGTGSQQILKKKISSSFQLFSCGGVRGLGSTV